MRFDEFIEKLNILFNNTHYKEVIEINFSEPIHFRDISNFLTVSYLGNDQVKEFIDTNNSDMLLKYFIGVLNELKTKYGKVLLNPVENLYWSIVNHNFNGIYTCFKNNFDYHKKYSLQDHISKYSDTNYTFYGENIYSAKYIAWANLLNDYYESIMNGDFSGIFKLYHNILIIKELNELLQLYNNTKLLNNEENKSTHNTK